MPLKNRDSKQRSPHLEEVEPRVMYSADAIGALESAFMPRDDQPVLEANLLPGNAALARDIAADQQSNPALNDEQVRREIVFVDSSLDDVDQLIAGITGSAGDNRNIEVVLLDAAKDGVDQISQFLAEQTDIDAIHIITHGKSSAVQLGSTTLDEAALQARADEIAGWGAALDEDADILIYGCDLAGNPNGVQFVDALAQITGAEVAASDDLTGAAQLGGDWDLEYRTGSVETQLAFSEGVQQQWNHVLMLAIDDTSTGTSTGSDITVSHTTSGTDRLMLVGISLNHALGTDDVTSVKYNGVDLTHVGTSITGDAHMEIWALTAPDVGTFNLVVDFNSPNDGSTVGVTTFTGVDQATPLGTFVSNTGTSATPAVSISSAVGELVFGVVAIDDATDRTVVPDAGQSERWEIYGTEINGAASTTTGAATVNVGWTSSGSDAWAAGAVPIKAASAPSGPLAQIFSLDATTTVSEETSDTITFTLTLAGDPLTGGDTASVDVTAGGTATSGTDYDNLVAALVSAAAATTGVSFDGADTLTFDSTFNAGAGEGSFVFTVDTINDAATEGTESLSAQLANPTATAGGAALGVFKDSFTEASDVLLTTHVPATGMSWTEIYETSGTGATIDSSIDVVRGGVNLNNTGQAYTIGPAPTSSDQTISFKLTEIDTSNGTKPVGLFARLADNSNFYFLQILPNDNGQDSIQLIKMDGGTDTTLVGIDATIAANDTFTLELVGTTLKAFHNGVEVLSTTDATFSSAGDWGVFFGNFGGEGHLRTNWAVDNVLASVASSAATITNITETDSGATALAQTTTSGGLSLNENGGNDAYLVADGGLPALTQFSFELQFAGTAAPGVDTFPFISYNTGSGDELSFNTNGTMLEIDIGGTSVNASAIDYAATLLDGARHTLSVTWDNAAGDWEVYIDGALVDSGTGLSVGETIITGGTLIFGQEQDSVGGGFDSAQTFRGTYYDARFFDDVRTAVEIDAYKQTTLGYDHSGLVANWQFNDLSTNNIVTEVVSGNDLTLQHAAGSGFVTGSAILVAQVDEGSSNGTIVGTIVGTDAERSALITTLLTADSDLSYSAETGKFYKTVNSTVSWSAAQTAATTTVLNGINGQMVTIHSSHENDLIEALATGIGQDVWLGISDEDSEGIWREYDGATAGTQFWEGDASGFRLEGAYVNWTTGEPNNSGTLANYGRLVQSDGLWRDTEAATSIAYVVEWDADTVLDNAGATGEQPLTYSVFSQTAAGAFTIDSDTGVITVADGTLLDYESATSHTITVRVTDVDNFTYDEAFTIKLNDVDRPSVIVLPVAQSVDEDTNLTFNSGNGNLISISDDTGESPYVTLSVTNGTLTVSGAGGATITGDGTSTITISGTLTDVNLALNGLVYDSSNDWNGAETLTITALDGDTHTLNIDGNLDGFYKFESGSPAADSSPGSPNPGVVVGGAVVVSDSERGDVIELDGAVDALQITGLMGSAANVTLAGWVNFDSGASDGELISIGGYVGIRVDKASGGVSGFFYDGASTHNVESALTIAGTGWHHVAYVFDDAADTQTLYLDGVAVAEATRTESISYAGLGSDTFIGRSGDAADKFLDGKVDDVRILSRTLTSGEIVGLVTAPDVLVTDTLGITVDAVNDNPTGSGSLTTTALNDNAGASSLFGGLTTSDVDVGENDLSLKITLTDPTAGTITGGGFTETGVGTGIYTVTGLTTTTADTALDNVQFTPTNNSGPSGNFTTDISVQINDQGGGGDQTVLAATTMTITRINDNPAGSGSLTTTSLNDNAGATSLYGGLSVTDVDVGENDLSLTITLTDPSSGTITGGGFTETGVGTGIYTVTGLTTTTADTALDNMQFTPTNNTGPSGNFTTDMSITVNDQGGGGEQTVLAATTVTVTRVNDNPSGAGSLTTTTLNDNAGASSLFGGLTTSDVDVGENDLSLKITLADPTAGTITGGGFTETGVGTGIYTVTGLTTTTADTALDNVQFTPTNNSGPSGNFTTDISVQINDQGGGGDQTVLAATTMTITRINDNPAGSGSLTTTSLNDNAGATSLYGGLSVTDVDVGENDLSLTITLTDPSSGTITGGGFTETGVGTGIYTVTGLTTTTADTALDNMQFTPTNNTGPSGNFTTDMSITVNDQGGGGEQTVLAATTVTVTRVNDNPAGAGSLTTTSLNDNAGASSLFGGLTTSDVDVGENDLSLKITLTDPTAGTITGGGFTETGVGTGIYTLTGLTTATADTALDNAQFTPTNNSGASDNFTTDISVTVNDQGGGGDQTVLAATTVTVTRINDDPTNAGSLPTDLAFTEATAGNVDFSSVDFNDIDASGADLTVTLTTSTGGNLSGVAGTGITLGGTPTALTITGNLTDLNNYFNVASNITYLHSTASTNGDNADTIQVNINDNGNGGTGGGADIDLGTVNVDISAVNNAPIITATLTDSTPEDSNLVFSSGNGNQISIADVDAGTSDLDVILNVTHGTLTLGGTTGLSFSDGDGTADTTMTFRGSLSEINTALDGLSYAPDSHYAGDAALTITVDDRGNTGSGGDLLDKDIIVISVLPDGTNDAPTNTVPGVQATDEDVALILSVASGNAVTISDDSVNNTVEVTLTADNGTLTLNKKVGPEVTVNTTTGSTQKEVQVVTTATGSGIAVWQSKDQDGDGEGIFAQLYDTNGVSVGVEFQVTTFTTDDQTSPDIAAAADGSFVIVWQSKNQDGGGGGIFGQRFDASGAALGAEFQVNTTTTEDQQLPSVAMNAAGEFVVAWQSKNQDGDGEGIYVQRYDSSGNTVGVETLVNAITSGNQKRPDVAIDSSGNFVVVWDSKGYDSDKEAIVGRRFEVGTGFGAEFQINTYETSSQITPVIAMQTTGEFVVAWESNGQDGSSKGIFAQRFDNSAVPVAIGVETQVNLTSANEQKAPSISMNASGDYAIVWQSKGQDNVDGKIGIYGQQFEADGTKLSSEFLVNSVTAGDQVSPSVSLQDDGSLWTAWDNKEIFSQRFQAPGVFTFTVGDGVSDTTVTFSGTQNDINAALDGLIYTPNKDFYGTDTITLTTNDNGHTGGGSLSDIDAFTVNVSAVNDAPLIDKPGVQSKTEDVALVFSTGNSNLISITDDAAGSSIEVTLTATNGTLTLNGTSGLTFSVGAGTNNDTMTFQGSLADVNAALDGMSFSNPNGFVGLGLVRVSVNDLGNTGGGALEHSASVYINTVQDAVNDAPTIQAPADLALPIDSVVSFDGANLISIGDDAATNDIEVTLTATNGEVTFNKQVAPEQLVNTETTEAQSAGVVATSTDGAYVVVWQSKNQDGNGEGIFAQRYDAFNNAVGDEIQINTVASGNQITPSVAMDPFGNFVVAWESDGNLDGDGRGIFVQLFTSDGDKIDIESQGNATSGDDQTLPSVAMDDSGNFVLVWQSKNQDGDGEGIFAQRFDSSGSAEGDEIQVNTTFAKHQVAPSVAMDATGNFVIVWQSQDQDGDGEGIYAQRFDADGNAQNAEFQVNFDSTKDQSAPSVAMNVGGFVIAWQSDSQDGNGDGIFARRFDAAGNALDAADVQVNTYTNSHQTVPEVSMNAVGEYIIAWQSKDQDSDGMGTYAQWFDASGTAVGGEVRLNSTVTDEQTAPSVAISGNGNYISVWTSKNQDGDREGIYSRQVGSPGGLTFTTGDGVDDSLIVVTGRLDHINTALNGMTFTPSAGFNGTATLQIDVDDLGSTGTGGAKTGTETINIVYNTAPTLNNTGAPVLTTLTEDETSNGGDLVSAILATGAGGDPISDADAGAVDGIAITGLSSGNGTWQYSTNGGGAWSDVATVSDTSALLLRSTDLVRFVPNGENATTGDFTFRAWDQTGGSFGSKVDVSTNGGNTSYSASTETAAITVTGLNDNPTGAGSLTTTSLNDNAGASNVFSGLSAIDVDAGESDLSLKITLTDPTAGIISGGGFTETGVGTGIYTLTGLTTATADTALDNVQFTPTNNTGPSGNFTTDISVSINDQDGGGDQDLLAATTMTINRVNDNPSGAGALTTTSLNDNVGASSLFDGLTTSDIDVGENDLSLKITLTDPTAGTVTGGGFTETGVGTGIYTVTGLTTASADTALDNVQFTPTNNSGPSGNFTTDISVQVNDQGGGGDQTVLAATTVTVTRINDNPAGSGSLTTTSLNDNAGATSLYGGLSVTDVDVGENDLSLTITLTDPASGTITGGGFTETGVGTGIYTVTGLTTTTADTALDNMQFTPTDNTGTSGNFTTDMSITVNDQGGGGEQTVLAATTVTVTRVNDNPSGSGSLTTTSLNDNAGATSLYGGLSVTDVDVGENDLSLTITLTDPTSGTITGGGFTETGVGTGIYTVTGLTTTTADAALDNMQFTPTNNTGPSGNFTTDMSITVNDQGGGGEQTVLAATTVTVTRVNDNPAGSGSLTTTSLNDNAGATSLYGGLSVTDVDVGENDLSLTITLTDPTSGTITGGGFTETGVGTGIYTVTGLTTTTADTALDNMQFTPTNNTGPSGNFTTDMSITANDQGGGGEQTVLAATTVTVTRVNDNPAGTGSLTTTSLNDNAGATSLYGGLSVTDVDVGENDLSLTITLTDPTSGTITGGGFTETGVGTGIYTVTGLTTTTADTALDNMQFTPTNNTGPSGNFTTDMSITVNDQGGGGEQTVLAATTVTVTRVNDNPAGSGSLTTTSLNDNAGATSLYGGLSVTDVDVGENDLSLTITLTDPTSGTITGGGFTETGVGTGIYTVTGLTTTTADTALDNMQFTPTNNTGPSGNFTTDMSITVNDQGGGGEQTVLAATTVTVTRVNDNPAGSGSLTTTSLNDNAGATSLYGGLSVTDVDVGENDLSLTITLTDPASGTITGGGFTETGVGTGIYTVTGLTTTTADTALDNMQFTPTNNTGPSGNFTTDMSITVNDQGGGGEQTVLAATTVTMTRINDNPAGAGSLTTTSLNDNAGATNLYGGLSVTDVDVGENDLSLTVTLTDPTSGTITGGGFTETGVGTGVYTVTGLTTATADTALDNMQFTPTNNTGPSGNFTTDMSITVNDQGGGGEQTVLAATTVTMTRINDNPAGAGSLTTTSLNDNAGATNLYGGLSVTDVDVGENDLSLTITLTDPSSGTITGGGFTETGVGTGIYTVTGLTTITADTALDNMQFTPTNNTGPSGNFTTDMSITVNDQGGGGEQTVLAATTVTVTRVNDNPAGSGSLTTTSLNDNAGATSLYGGLSVTDVDVGENDLSLTITLTDPASGTITGGGFTETGVGTGIYTVTGLTTTMADTALDNMQFTPTNNTGPSGNFTTDMSITVNDQGGGGEQTVLAATTVTITRINDNPAGAGSLTATALNDNAGATNLYGGLSVTDVDVGENDLSLTITLTDPTSGTITGGGFTETGVGTGIYTVTGLTTTTADTALDNMQFTPTNNTGPSGNFTTDMSITVNDQGGGGEQTVLAATTVTVTRINDNPVGAGSLTTTSLNDNAGATNLYGGLSVTDVDVGENDLSLTITLTDPSSGTITGGGFTETGVGTGIYTVTGLTTTTADTALDNMQFTPTNNTGPSGNFTTDMSITVNDQGGGGEQTVLAATTVTVTRVNDNPAGSGSLTTTSLNDNAGATSLYGGLSVTDVDVGENDLSLTITLTDPASGTITGGGFTETGVGTGIYTVTGLTTTMADTALDNMQFTPTNNTGPSGNFTTDMSITVNDQGGGGEQTVLAATTVTITRINDNPAGAGSLTATALNDNAGATNLYGGLSVTDVDVGENDLSLTITLTDPTSGTITGGGFTETGVGTGIYTVTGLTTTTADTALDNMQFTPTNNTGPSGNFTTDMSITVNDQGGGGEQTVLAATTVTVTRVNDNPAGSGSLTTTSLNDNAGATSLYGGLSVTDVDVGENDLSLTITLTDPTSGTITGGGFTETGVGTGIYTVTGLTTTTADTALDNMQFTPTNNTGPSGNFTTVMSITVNDQGGGGEQTVLAATTVTVTRVNDNPAGSGSLTTTSLNDNAGATSLYGGLSVTDVDVGENDLSLTITLTDPTSGTITGGGFTETGVGTGIYTVTGLTTTTADIALDNMQFTPTNNTGPSGNFTTDMSITVNDQSGGGEQTVLAATTVTVTRVNDNPAGSGSLTTTSLNDNAGATSLYGGLSVTDVDVGENDLSLTITLTDPTSGTITGGGFTETGVGTGIYTVTGLTTTTADTALDNMQFTPTNNTGPSGNFTTDMSITVNDQGGAGEQTLLAATTVTVTRVNDNPTGAGSLITTSLNDDAGGTNLFGGLSISDVDNGEIDLTLKIILSDPTAGEITGGGFIETGVGTGIYTLTALTTATADAALDSVQFTPTNNTGLSGNFSTDISVQVNDQSGGNDQEVLAATTVTITRVNHAPVGEPVIDGAAVEDQLLTANTEGVTDADGLGEFTYQWLRDGIAIADATASTYLLSGDDVDAQISVQVDYVDGDSNLESLTSQPTEPVENTNNTPLGNPVVVGESLQNRSLTVDVDSITDADGVGSFSFQWLRDGTPIAGATEPEYLLENSDIGARISVRVEYLDGQGTPESFTSEPSEAVSAAIQTLETSPVPQEERLQSITVRPLGSDPSNSEIVTEVQPEPESEAEQEPADETSGDEAVIADVPNLGLNNLIPEDRGTPSERRDDPRQGSESQNIVNELSFEEVVTQLFDQSENNLDTVMLINESSFERSESDRESLRQNLKRVSEEMEESAKEEQLEDRVINAAFKVGGIVGSGGGMAWLLRGASMFASALTLVPTWRGFDPLPILEESERRTKPQGKTKRDSNSMLDDEEETRVGQVLDALGNFEHQDDKTGPNNPQTDETDQVKPNTDNPENDSGDKS